MPALALIGGRKRFSLEDWVREVMIVDAVEYGATISAIGLVHMRGMQEETLYMMKLGGTPKEPKEIAQLMQHKAENYAQDLPGTQTFQLIAFYGESSEPKAKHPFTVSGGQDQYASGLMTEGPTPQGALQQMMRTYEISQQATFRKDIALFEIQHRTISEQNQMMIAIMRENREAIELAKACIFERAANEHEYRMKERQYERDTAERKQWITYLPALANTVLGKEIFPVGTQDTAILQSIAESLSEEQAMELSKHLPPSVVGILFNRFEGFMKEKKLKMDSEKRLIKGINPEDDAAGD